MTTSAQTRANRINGARSRGPVTDEGKFRSCMNSLQTGHRAQALILPGENGQEYEGELDQLIQDLQPRDGTELGLVHEIATAKWFHRRVKRAQFYRLKTAIDGAGDRENQDVALTLDRLFTDAGRPLALYCISSAACGGPLTSSPEKVDDSQKPRALVERLEASAKGCQAMIDVWREISARVVQNLELQPQDRLRAIRMLGKQPVDCALDQRVWVIYVASFGLHPAGKKHPFEDLKSDMGTAQLEAFLRRVQRHWGLPLDASDTAGCKRALLDLITRNIERLEAKREAYLEHADEGAVSIAARLAYEESPQGERLARHELACERRTQRCRDAFWKHRREMGGREKDGGRRTEDGGEGFEAVNVAEMRAESRAAEEVSSAPYKNLTSEPNRGLTASQTAAEKESAALIEAAQQGLELLSRMRDLGVGTSGTPAGGGGTGLSPIEQAIFGGRPLLKPIS
jgi:hypothetical protein